MILSRPIFHGDSRDLGKRSVPAARTAAILALVLTGLCFASPGDGALDRPLTAGVLESSSGRFTIVGTNTLENMDLAAWAERVTAKIERAIGVDIRDEGYPLIRIIVRPPGDDSRGGVEFRRGLEAGRVVQRLLIHGYDEVSHEEATEILCRMLVDSYVIARQREQARTRGLRFAPPWMSIGMARNLDPSLREQNAELALALWQEGKLPSLGAILSSREGDASPARKAAYGVFFAWLRSWPESSECFQGMFRKLADGAVVPAEWLAAHMPGDASGTDLDEGWDRWMLRQKRVVYVLHKHGAATPRLVDQLKAQLLLYPGDFGIPLGGDAGREIRLEDLVELREESWIPTFSRNKSASLRLLAVGREAAFRDVVEAYCRFLDALAGGKRERVLVRLLAEADEDLAALTGRVAGTPGNTERGTRPGGETDE